MNTRKEVEYDLEVNHKSDALHYRYVLYKWNETHTKLYRVLETNSKERLYIELDLLGIRDNMKFEKFYREQFYKEDKNEDRHIIFSMFKF